MAGHAILGLDLTSFSLVGLIGLTGVVVNDSLVLTYAYSRSLIRPGYGIGYLPSEPAFSGESPSSVRLSALGANSWSLLMSVLS